jgi:nitrogen-specific signal transduction histidine kinase
MLVTPRDQHAQEQASTPEPLKYDLSWFQALADNVSYGIALISVDLEVLFVNKQAKLTLESYGECVVQDRHLSSRTPSSQMTRLINAVRQAKNGTRQMVLFQKNDNQCAIAVSPIELGTGTTYVLLTPERINNCDKQSLTSYGRFNVRGNSGSRKAH